MKTEQLTMILQRFHKIKQTGNVSQSDELISDRCNIEIDDNNSKQVDDWTEDDVEIPAGITDTMLTANDFLEDSEQPQIYSIAPGETSVPLSIFRDTYSEELAYPQSATK